MKVPKGESECKSPVSRSNRCSQKEQCWTEWDESLRPLTAIQCMLPKISFVEAEPGRLSSSEFARDCSVLSAVASPLPRKKGNVLVIREFWWLSWGDLSKCSSEFRGNAEDDGSSRSRL